MEILLGNRKIGDGHPLFFIAEAGVNHNGDIKLAKKLIDVAVEANADAVKFQTFKASELNTLDAPKASYHIETTGSDKEQSWYELLQSQELTFEMHHDLIEYCKEKNIMFLSTPYSNLSVDLLEKFDLPAYKIASADLNNLPFLDYISSKGRPIIISTGMSNLEEIKMAKNIFIKNKLEDFIFLQCTSNYPTNLYDSNLRVIKLFREELNCLTGYSDHTDGMINAIASVAIGACVFEKHFTLDKNMTGPDHRMSLSPSELIETVKVIRETEKTLGRSEKYVLDSEKDNRLKLRKSIVSNSNINKSDIIKENMIAIKRPGSGLPPSDLKKVIGKVAKINIPNGTVLTKEMLDDKKN